MAEYPMLDFLSFAGLALLLGFKHSYDADHIIAVSNFLRKSGSFRHSAWISLSWAIGHMLTAAIVTTAFYFFRESLLSGILAHFEKIAGVMLIALGLWSLKDLFGVHTHEHSHQGREHVHPHTHGKGRQNAQGHGHVHKRMFGIGIIHGLASNDELLVLMAASLGLATLAPILAGVAVFSLGVVLGMMLFALVFSYPLLKAKSDAAYRLLTIVTGTVSVAYGGLMLAGIAGY